MKRLDWTYGLLMFVSCALVGCGTSSGGSSPDSGTGSDAKHDTGGSDGGGSCSAPDGTGKPFSGVLLLSEETFPTPTNFGIIGAFYSGIVHSDACNGMMVGACCYQTPASTPPGISAGTLTVTDGSTTLATLMSPEYASSSELDKSVMWAPGDTIKIAGSGGMFDAFSLSVVTPSLLSGVKPALSAALTVPTSSDLVVTWTPSGQACSKVIFGLSQANENAGIGCSADDSDGTLSVPSALLGKFTATSGTASIQRVETAGVLAANGVVGVAASNVNFQKSVTYTK